MTETAVTSQRGIQLTETALKHVSMLQEQQGNKDLCLRVGVRQGGCSGMSYMMDFEDPSTFAKMTKSLITTDLELSVTPKAFSISMV